MVKGALCISSVSLLSSVSIWMGLWMYSSVVGITAAATLRQVQKHTSAKVVKRLCRKIKVAAP